VLVEQILRAVLSAIILTPGIMDAIKMFAYQLQYRFARIVIPTVGKTNGDASFSVFSGFQAAA